MSSNDPRPGGERPGGAGGPPGGKADWRGKAKSPALGGRLPVGQGGWRQRVDLWYRRAQRWYRIRLISLALLALALIVGFVYWVFRQPQFTPFVGLAVTDYGGRLPPNAWAQEDLRKFQELGTGGEEGGKRILRFAAATYAAGESGVAALSPLRAEILRTQGGGPGKETLVVYLSMHGGLDEQGNPCFLPPQTSPSEPPAGIPLRDVLQYLFPKEAAGTLPKRKLLILDCNRMDCNWRLGLLYNAFADRLKAAVDEARIQVPGLAVLNSTGPGQLGWTSPEQFQGSVFGYFVREGLRGVADNPAEGGDGNGQVSLQELYRFVRKQVAQWVLENRCDVQRPMLLPESDDFPLAHVPKGQPLEMPNRVDLSTDPRWKDVDDLWKSHAALGGEQAWRIDPLGWAEFQEKLLRLGQLALAGGAYEAEFDRTRSRLAELAAQLGRDPLLDADLAAHTLPLAMAFHGDANLPRQREKLRGEWSKPPPKIDPARARSYGYLAAAAEAWAQCIEKPGSEAALLAFLDNTQRPRSLEPGLVELHFLRMLQSSYLDPAVRSAQPDLLPAALRVRDLAERAAFPGEPRIYYAIEPLVDRADADRRRAEDLLFVGNPDSLQEAGRLYAGLRAADGKSGSYDQAVQRAAVVRAAFEVRDRAWAEIPYLARWHLARLHPSDPAQLDKLAAVIRSTQALARQLDRPLVQGELAPDLEKAYQAAAGRLKDLEQQIEGECNRLRIAGADKKTLQEIGVVLDLPLVSGVDRQTLREKYLKIAARESIAEDARRVAAAGEPAARESEFLASLTQRPEHLLLAILDRTYLEDEVIPAGAAAGAGPPGPSPPDRAAAADDARLQAVLDQGKRVRQLLLSVRSEADKWSGGTARQLRREEPAAPLEVRRGASKADQLVRAAAALLDPDALAWESGEDPPRQLRRLDLYYLLLWHAGRTMEDFWGPPPGTRGEPFFQLAAEGYLGSAEKLLRGGLEPHYGKQNLRKLLESRRQAARQWIALAVQDLMVDKADPARKGDLLVPLSLSATLARDLPKGVAAIYLEDPEGSRTIPLSVESKEKTPQLRRIEVPVDGQWTPKPYGVRGDDPALSQPDFQAKELRMVAFYRGHVKPQDLVATSLEAERVVVYEPPRYPKPTITVQGEATQGSSLVFILDCSGSMSYPTTLGGRRIDVARNALKSVLAALAALPGEPYQVAMIAYGHRRGWGEGDTILVWDFTKIKDPKAPRDYERQTRPATPAERKITPSNDVDLIWPLGPLRKDSLDELNDILDGLHPWGETPLYLSIIQAVDVASRAATPQRRIIAITDGVNEQSENPTSYEAVARKLADAKDVGLDVVRFRLSDQDLLAEAEARWKDDKDKVQAQLEEFKQKRAELERLTGSPGGPRRGNVFAVDDESRFLKALQESLRLRQFVVRRAVDGELITRPPRNLGDTVTIEQAARDKVKYVVALADQEPPVEKQVELEGGEALQLIAKQVGQRLALEFDRYDDRRRGEPQLVTDPTQSARRLYLAAHEPKRFASTVRFYVSAQNGDKRDFSPRPEEAWVQVQPLGSDGPLGLPYVFYDLRFWAGRPVPVLSCDAPHWPAGAGHAAISLWCRWKKTDAQRIPIVDLRRKGSLDLESPQATLQLEEKPGEAGGRYQVIVTERHPPGGDLIALKVEMLPPPAKAIHQYFPETGKFHRPFVRHIFLYESREADRIPGYEVLVTPRAKLTDPAQAVSLKEPFRVDIPTRDSPASEQQE